MDFYKNWQSRVFSTGNRSKISRFMIVLPFCLLTLLESGFKNKFDDPGNEIVLRLEPGPENPRNSEGDFSNSFNYKNIGLYVRTDFTLGHTIYNYARGTLIGQFQGDNGLSKDLLRSWQKQGDVTNIPAFVYADQQVRNKLYRGGAGNTMFYEKGDYLAIRELTLTYDLPKALLKRAKISGLRLNVTGHNLLKGSFNF